MLPFLARSQAVLPAAVETAILTAPYALSVVSERLYATTRRSRTTSQSKVAAEAEVQAPAPSSSGSSGTSSQAGTKLAMAAAALQQAAPKPERIAAMNSAIQQLNKKLGAGTVMRLGDQQAHNIECIPSGTARRLYHFCTASGNDLSVIGVCQAVVAM